MAASSICDRRRAPCSAAPPATDVRPAAAKLAVAEKHMAVNLRRTLDARLTRHDAVFRMRIAQDTFSPAMSSLALEVGPLTSRECATLPDVLRRRATQQPERLGYRFLLDRAETSLTYGELDRRARAIAATLASLRAPRAPRAPRGGERVLIIFPPGLDFICAWFGCAYAGAAAVALPPPQAARARRFMSTTAAIAADAQPVAG